MAVKQNIKVKPFGWADLTLIVQFNFCPNCKYYSNCYDLAELARNYDGKATVRGQPNYLSESCFDNMEGENAEMDS